MERKRVSTGIAGLDPLLEGGFLRGKSYLVTGDTGTGKTIFAMQFVLKGLLEGEKAVYVAVDEKPTDILDAALSLGWNLNQYIEQKNLLILDASPYFTARMGSKEKDVDVQKTVNDLASYVKRMEATRVVIDPVGPLLVSRDVGGHLAQDYARTLIHALHDKLGTTNVLTSYVPAGAAADGEQGAEVAIAAGVVMLSLTRTQNRMVRTLMVRKMRGTAIDLVEYQFVLMKEKGIVLKPVF